MVHGSSLNLCRMIVIICIQSLCPGVLQTLQAKKRLAKVLIKRPFSYVKKALSIHIVIVSLTDINIQ